MDQGRINTAADYWSLGRNTAQIAKIMKLPEFEIYNHLENIVELAAKKRRVHIQ